MAPVTLAHRCAHSTRRRCDGTALPVGEDEVERHVVGGREVAGDDTQGGSYGVRLGDDRSRDQRVVGGVAVGTDGMDVRPRQR